MKVLVSNTSVLIDLDRAYLIERLFPLPYEFVVPDLLFCLELQAWGKPDLRSYGLRVEELTSDEVGAAVQLKRGRNALSTVDTLAYCLAEARRWVLLSADGELRKLAEQNGLEMHARAPGPAPRRCGRPRRPSHHRRAPSTSTIDEPWRDDAVPPQRAATQTSHRRRQPGLVDEDQAGRIEVGLAVEPVLPAPSDVRAVLLASMRGLLKVVPRLATKCHTVDGQAFTLSVQRRSAISTRMMSTSSSTRPKMKSSCGSSLQRSGWPCCLGARFPVRRQSRCHGPAGLNR